MKEDERPSNAFQQALIGGLPVLLGALFGGDEGGALGAQVGVGALSQLQQEEAARQAAIQKQKFELEKQKQGLDIFKEKEMFKEEVSAPRMEEERNIKKKSQQLREAELKQNQEQFVAGEKRRLDQLNNTIKEQEQLSDAQVSKLASITSTKKLVDSYNIDAISEGGPIEGRLKDLAMSFGVDPGTKYAELANKTGATLAIFVKSISGSAVSEPEAQRLAKLIPSPNQDPELFLSNLKTFKDQLNTSLESEVNAIKQLQPKREKNVDLFFQKIKEDDAKKQLESSSFKPGMKVKDKRTGKILTIVE